MEREISNLVPLIGVRPLFESTKPMMNTSFRKPLIALGHKDITTVWIMLAVLEVRKERTAGLIEQGNLAERAALVSDTEPSTLWPHMRVLAQKMSNITDAASCPIAERKECFSPQICCLHDQCLHKSALLIRGTAWSSSLW